MRSPLRSRNTSPTRTPKLSPLPLPGPTRPYQELVLKTNALMRDYAQLEEELTEKLLAIQDLLLKVSQLELALKQMQQNRENDVSLYEKEIAFYKEKIADLQRKNLRLVADLDSKRVFLNNLYDESEDKYGKLLRQYRALQLDFELEKNSKALLIDQIEYLLKERDFLLSHNSPNSLLPSAGQDKLLVNNLDADVSENDYYSDSDGSVHGTHLLSDLVEIDDLENIDASSPIKNDPEMPESFQFPPPFPPSPEPQAKSVKRMSLPAKLKMSPEVDDFVLLPLKLPSHTTLFSDEPPVQKRWSTLKPNHSRYNSHDIVPIKVEFEDRRLASAPIKEKKEPEDLEEELAEPGTDRDEAFMKLNGFGASKRDSLVTASSKRSSLYTDFNVLSGDITKQEIMKLKFELQLLRLHNEKLLSYIGFELQKQKKNIKKLLSRNNLREPRKRMEYLDAKLIEKLRNMLIQKKRVLRLVSVNPILLTKYPQPKRNLVDSGLGLGLFASPDEEVPDVPDFVFRSNFVNFEDSVDDYGFMNHHKNHDSRLFSHNTNEYLENEPNKQPKKFKSQTFSPNSDDEFALSWDDIDESESEESALSSDVDYNKLNPFNQIRYFLLGKQHFKKREEPLVDEHLKYKFLTIVIGIAIVGLRLTTTTQQNH